MSLSEFNTVANAIIRFCKRYNPYIKQATKKDHCYVLFFENAEKAVRYAEVDRVDVKLSTVKNISMWHQEKLSKILLKRMIMHPERSVIMTKEYVTDLEQSLMNSQQCGVRIVVVFFMYMVPVDTNGDDCRYGYCFITDIPPNFDNNTLTGELKSARNEALQEMQARAEENFRILAQLTGRSVENIKQEITNRREMQNLVHSHGRVPQQYYDDIMMQNKLCMSCKKEAKKRCMVCCASYCSVTCQKADWPKHKSVCQFLKNVREMCASLQTEK